MNHVMLDLETMGNSSTAAISAIGACFFDPNTGEIGETFYTVVDIEDSAQYGEIDASTIKWWLKQSDAARGMYQDSKQLTLKAALDTFSDWCANVEKRKLQVWGNGVSFDNVILRNAYHALGMSEPWVFYNDRDVRTIVELGKTLRNIDPKKQMPFTGVRHNAVDDSIHQAQYVSAIIQALA